MARQAVLFVLFCMFAGAFLAFAGRAFDAWLGEPDVIKVEEPAATFEDRFYYVDCALQCRA